MAFGNVHAELGNEIPNDENRQLLFPARVSGDPGCRKVEHDAIRVRDYHNNNNRDTLPRSETPLSMPNNKYPRRWANAPRPKSVSYDKMESRFSEKTLQDTPTSYNNSDGLGSLWDDIAAAGTGLLKTGSSIYETYQRGEIAKTQAEIEKARAATTTAQPTGVSVMSYVPWVIGFGGVMLILSFLKKGR